MFLLTLRRLFLVSSTFGLTFTFVSAGVPTCSFASSLAKTPVPQQPSPTRSPGPDRAQVRASLERAVQFFHRSVSTHGGYVWRYSSDLQHRQGEAVTDREQIWIQPPGTPSIGEAFLRAYAATGDEFHLEAASSVAAALVNTQLHSGGWNYSGQFAPEARAKQNYRTLPSAGKPESRTDADSPGGWQEWRQRRNRGNITVLDDDTTFAALRFLMRYDRTTNFQEVAVHEAVEFALGSLLKAQYPVGAWSHNYDSRPRKSPDAEFYAVIDAAVPDAWSRTWTKKYAGCYELNDRISTDGMSTMLLAFDIYEDERYLNSALAVGEFLLRAQLPEPQPAWAQQYDRHMQPVWSRAFEPPAITGFESQAVIESLTELYSRTADNRFAAAAMKAIEYLKSIRLDDGSLARFYELKTSRPLYFNTRYELTYKPNDLPDHYAFVVESHLDRLEMKLRSLQQSKAESGEPEKDHALQPQLGRDSKPSEAMRNAVQGVLDAQDERGAWTEPGWVRDAEGKKVVPEDGVIQCTTFIANVKLLCRYLEQLDRP